MMTLMSTPQHVNTPPTFPRLPPQPAMHMPTSMSSPHHEESARKWRVHAAAAAPSERAEASAPGLRLQCLLHAAFAAAPRATGVKRSPASAFGPFPAARPAQQARCAGSPSSSCSHASSLDEATSALWRLRSATVSLSAGPSTLSAGAAPLMCPRTPVPATHERLQHLVPTTAGAVVQEQHPAVTGRSVGLEDARQAFLCMHLLACLVCTALSPSPRRSAALHQPAAHDAAPPPSSLCPACAARPPSLPLPQPGHRPPSTVPCWLRGSPSFRPRCRRHRWRSYAPRTRSWPASLEHRPGHHSSSALGVRLGTPQACTQSPQFKGN